MNINKNSWHYKLVKELDHYFIVQCERKNSIDLCPYMRKLIFSIFVNFIYNSLSFLIVIYVFSCVTSFFMSILGFIDFSSASDGTKVLITCGGFITFASLLCLLIFHSQEKGSIKKYREKNKESIKCSNIFRLWLQSKKDKYCPKLDIVE